MRLVLAGLLAVASVGGDQGGQHLGRTAEQWRSGLEATNRVERLIAARSIGEMAIAGMQGAPEALIEALDHNDGGVRYWAAVAAAHLRVRGRQLSETLPALLNDDVPEVRVQAARALVGTQHSEAAVGALRSALSHRNRGVRLHAAHAADALGDAARPLAEDLRAAVGDSFDYVQRVARHALWTLGERPCPYRTCD